ncbi:hypothetical protein HDF19_15760 [Mucilaginibacter sp. E4BP6]|jgi:hypothetical protein|nr:hypothetical protein [Mucilaginibacter sp. E4BP6]NYE65540.1 hypothetical protein [Mucilaginibacter sp. E4BP6]
MKATTQKLKKLKTKQVYGFKKNDFDKSGFIADTTALTTTTHVIINI